VLFAIPTLGYMILVITNFVLLKIVLNDKIWIFINGQCLIYNIFYVIMSFFGNVSNYDSVTSLFWFFWIYVNCVMIDDIS